MKIRTDFVTNSSSSSFSLILTVRGVDGSEVSYCDFPHSEDGGEAKFERILSLLSVEHIIKSIQSSGNQGYKLSSDAASKARMKSVKDGEELQLKKGNRSNTTLQAGKWVTFFPLEVWSDAGLLGELPNSIATTVNQIINHPGISLRATACKEKPSRPCTVKLTANRKDGFTDLVLSKDVSSLAEMLMESTKNDYGNANAREKQRFSSAMKNSFKSLEQIEKITVERNYYAWGEFADPVAENDETLKMLSERVVECDGEDRQHALQEMREYVKMPNAGRQNPFLSFGCGFEDFRYACELDDRALLRIALCVCSPCGADHVEGLEHEEIEFRTGKSEVYAVFDLKPYAQSMNSFTAVRKKLADERQRKSEQKQELRDSWMKLYADVLTRDPTLVIPEKIFVFAGFYPDDQIRYTRALTERGGLIRTSISGKTDYLVVNPSGTYREGKIDKALEHQAKGKNVQIILPDELDKALYLC